MPRLAPGKRFAESWLQSSENSPRFQSVTSTRDEWNSPNNRTANVSQAVQTLTVAENVRRQRMAERGQARCHTSDNRAELPTANKHSCGIRRMRILTARRLKCIIDEMRRAKQDIVLPSPPVLREKGWG